jgi:hypothetical protein
MKCAKWICALSLVFGSVGISWSQSTWESTVRELVQTAVQAQKPQPWASLLIQADTEAVKLVRRERNECCDVRCVKLAGFGDLHYRWNDLQQSENYEHDLLRKVVHHLRGTPPGADALAALLSLGPYGGPWFDDDELLPDEFTEMALHRRIIAILTSPSWQKLKDARLMKMLAEAYETWWSLSLAKPDDPELQQSAAHATDYLNGAEFARRKAIELYDSTLGNRNDPSLRSRIASLRRRQDTHQRAWFRAGD